MHNVTTTTSKRSGLPALLYIVIASVIVGIVANKCNLPTLPIVTAIVLTVVVSISGSIASSPDATNKPLYVACIATLITALILGFGFHMGPLSIFGVVIVAFVSYIFCLLFG